MKLGFTIPATLIAMTLLGMSGARAEDIEPGPQRLEIASADGDYRLQLFGRIIYDAGGFNSDLKQLDDTQHVDSARLGLSGTVAHDFDFALQYELANAIRANEPPAELKDAWVAYTGLDSWIFRVGQFEEPFSLEEQTSSRYITFMERALPNVFAPGYHAGAAIAYQAKRWQATGGFFDRSTGPGSDDEGWGYSARISAAPIYGDNRVLHLGASMAYRSPDDNSVRFRVHPESGLTDERLINTGTVDDVGGYGVQGLEAAWVNGQWSLQAEYMSTRLDRFNGNPDVDLQGGYLYASWFPTGESRAYSPKRGVFTRIKPKRSLGAIELALRRSWLDLNDADIDGGVERNWTLGVNWYVSERARLMADAIWVDSTRRGVEDNPSILQARLQIEF